MKISVYVLNPNSGIGDIGVRKIPNGTSNPITCAGLTSSNSNEKPITPEKKRGCLKPNY